MLKWIINDWKTIRNQSSVKVAIINISYGFDDVESQLTGQNAIGYNQWRDTLNEAVSEGLLPVVASGNNGSGEVTAYPALFAGLHDWNTGKDDLSTPSVPQMLVAAATDNTGRYSSNVDDLDLRSCIQTDTDLESSFGLCENRRTWCKCNCCQQ